MQFLDLTVPLEELKSSFKLRFKMDFYYSGLASSFDLARLPDMKKCLDCLNGLIEIEVLGIEEKMEYLMKFLLKYSPMNIINDLCSSMKMRNQMSQNIENRFLSYLKNIEAVLEENNYIESFQYFFLGRFHAKFPKTRLQDIVKEVNKNLKDIKDCETIGSTEVLCGVLLSLCDNEPTPQEEEKSNQHELRATQYKYPDDDHKVNHSGDDIDYQRRQFEELAILERARQAELDDIIASELLLIQDEQLALQLREEEEKELKLECPICLEPIEGNFIPLSSCSHSFHIECISEYIRRQVAVKQIPVKCPSCKQNLQQTDVVDFLPTREDQNKFLDFELQQHLETHPQQYKYCPTPTCKMVYEVNENITQFKCQKCNGDYCLNCGVPWHNGLTCQQYKNQFTDSFAENFATNNRWKRCPQCQFYVAKEQGCDHITCRCGCKFCYKCGLKRDGACRCG